MNRDSVIARLKQFEGTTDWMYKCTGGDVTVGIGHALQTVDNAQALHWNVNDISATADQVAKDYNAIQNGPINWVASAYMGMTDSRLPPAGIEALIQADCERFEFELLHAIVKWDELPAPAQEALFDMAFNLGVAGLMKFERMLAAVDAGNWNPAVAQQ